MEESFSSAWLRVSEGLKKRGSLGARLHRGADGLWYSYAQWPSAEQRDRAFQAGPADEAAADQMKAAIAERFPEIVLEPVADLIGG